MGRFAVAVATGRLAVAMGGLGLGRGLVLAFAADLGLAFPCHLAGRLVGGLTRGTFSSGHFLF